MKFRMPAVGTLLAGAQNQPGMNGARSRPLIAEDECQAAAIQAAGNCAASSLPSPAIRNQCLTTLSFSLAGCRIALFEHHVKFERNHLPHSQITAKNCPKLSVHPRKDQGTVHLVLLLAGLHFGRICTVFGLQ